MLFRSCGLDDCIYVIGGWDRRTVYETVEKYDLNKKEWSFVESMSMKRYSHTACVVEEKIFVVGRLNADGKVIKEIECYDPTADKWKVVGETKKDFYDHALVAV